eukprot:3834224-Rhodomonas_salina.1
MISCRTWGGAVAVATSIGMSGSFSRKRDMFRYDGRKSNPCCETKCASSTASIMIGRMLVWILSGVALVDANEIAISRLNLLLIALIWSLMSDNSGLTITTIR